MERRRFTRLAVPGFGIGAIGVLISHFALPRWLGTWGTTAHEQTMPVPGDDLTPKDAAQQTMAVSINARPDQIWPWLVQMGIDRAGLYSWLWVENGLMRLGATNADEIHPEWQDLKIGDVMAFTPEHYPGGRRGPKVVAIQPEHSLVLDSSPGAPHGTIFATWQFLLTSTDDGRTRLLMRSRADRRRPLGLRVMDFVLQPGYLLMDRAMLLGIRSRAERIARESDAGDFAEPSVFTSPAIAPMVNAAEAESAARA
jgi:hypothetical protein